MVKGLLEHFPNRKAHCLFVRNEMNRGVSTSRNRGLEVASGEYIYFCDNDDWVAKEMLESMYGHAKSKNSDLVLCDMIAVYSNGRTDRIPVVYPNVNRVTALKKYISSVWNPIWNMLIRRDLFQKNYISFPEGKNMCEDYNVSTKLLLKAENPIHLGEAYYYYNRGNLSSFLHGKKPEANWMKIAVNIDLIDYFKREGVYGIYKKELCWRLLNAKQELCFSPVTYGEFLSIFPESHTYILSCPYLSRKVKLTMWCLTHHLRFVSEFASFCRRLKYKNRE